MYLDFAPPFKYILPLKNTERNLLDIKNLVLCE